MDLSTTYLGLKLPHPLVLGASPLVRDLDAVKQAEDAGAAAIVMNSLFEEQLVLDQMAAHQHTAAPAESFAEALSYLPDAGDYLFGPEEYLNHLRRVKEAVKIPVIGSLNGVTPEGWLDHAKLIESAGADALELNVYHLAFDPSFSGADSEQRSLEMVRKVKQAIGIPLAVKLSPFYTSLSHFAQQLDGIGVDGLVLFNRFYQPDINVEQLDVDNRLELSTSAELRLRLRWLAALSGRVKASLGASGGVHQGLDALKAVMAGAHAVQMVSAVLQHGCGRLTQVRTELSEWLTAHEYESLQQAQGSMNLLRSPNPSAYERANYMRVLQSWHQSSATSAG
jgi:dihydroorotate dehydrogenase (fumarate)